MVLAMFTSPAVYRGIQPKNFRVMVPKYSVVRHNTTNANARVKTSPSESSNGQVTMLRAECLKGLLIDYGKSVLSPRIVSHATGRVVYLCTRAYVVVRNGMMIKNACVTQSKILQSSYNHF